MSFFSNYSYIFKNHLFGNFGVPRWASLWTGYYISAKGSRFGKTLGASGYSEGDSEGAITLVHFWGASRQMLDRPTFWQAVGWSDANGFKRLSLVISWIISLPFFVVTFGLWLIGSLPVFVRYLALLWREGDLTDENKLAISKHWFSRVWAFFFMVPGLMLIGIYRNVFDFSGKQPVQQIFLTSLVLSFIFIPSFHLTVGVALSGAGMAGIALGGFPVILMMIGMVLVGLGLKYALTKTEKNELEQLKLQRAQLRVFERELHAIENEIADALRISDKKEFIALINKNLKTLPDSELTPNTLKTLFGGAYSKSNLLKVNDLFVVLLQKENNRRMFLRKNKTFKMLKLRARYYSPWLLNAGVTSFTLGLIGAIFLAPSLVSLSLFLSILPYSLPLLIIGTLILGLFAYMKVGSEFFTTTPQRRLLGLFVVVIVMLMLGSFMSPVTALIASSASNEYQVSVIFGIFATIMAIGTGLFYKTKIDYQEKETYPDLIKLKIPGQSGSLYVFRRVGPPYSKEVHYEKIGIEILKKNADGTETLYRVKQNSHDSLFTLTMMGKNGGKGLDRTVIKERLQEEPYSFSPELLSDTSFKKEYKAQTRGKDSAGVESTLLLDGTLTSIHLKTGLKFATVACTKESEFAVEVTFIEEGARHNKICASREQAKAFLKEYGFGGVAGMEKIEALGRYQARIARDIQVLLSDEVTNLYCQPGEKPVVLAVRDHHPFTKLGAGQPPDKKQTEVRGASEVGKGKKIHVGFDYHPASPTSLLSSSSLVSPISRESMSLASGRSGSRSLS